MSASQIGKEGPEACGYVCNLTRYALLNISGTDAQEFLQNQLSCDVDALAKNSLCSYGSYCNAQGRVLASFLLWRQLDSWNMLMHSSIADSVRKRLAMFILRAKVSINDITELCDFYGVSGKCAQDEIEALVPECSNDLRAVHASKSGMSVINVSDMRWLLILPAGKNDPVTTKLPAQIQRLGESEWDLSEIRAGVPWISSETQEAFIPQMLNLDLIGGVSFRKGCYPGQEIVARARYLGKVKRRLHRAKVTNVLAKSGDSLIAGEGSQQTVGTVINAAQAQDGNCELLAVVQTDLVGSITVRLGSAHEAPLQFLSLPYSLAEESAVRQ